MGAARVIDLLERLGGVSTRGALVRGTSRAEVDRAVAGGEVRPVARGRYVLADVDDALATAHRVAGVLSWRSAALHHGWAVKTIPRLPEVSVGRRRRVPPGSGAVVHYADLQVDEVAGPATSPDRTLLDCLRNLPVDEALAVADSALRDGYSPARLGALARDTRGAGAARVRHVAAHATGAAANPFESALRAICLEVTGLCVRAQVSIVDPVFLGRPDLVDERLRLVLEADSFTWHGHRAALARDARRYNALVVAGWLVLRFSFDDVMHHPAVVRATLARAVDRRAEVPCPTCRPA